MKKTLFATISILLMLFAFVACDGGSQGPTGGDVTESEAKTLAGNYLGSINFSQLIVDAFDNEVKGVSVESATANGFVITLKDYSGDAFKETTLKIPASKAAAADSATDTDDTESSEEEGESIKISKIASGSIEFTFTTADSKTTYTARTLEKAPIVFEGAPEGADLAFEISGPASVSFSKLSGGIITGFESKSTVKISAPTTSEISVGGASVDYDDIKESAKGGFDQTVTIPVADEEEGGETGGDTSFTKDDAATAISDIFNDISRAKLKEDMMKGLNGLDSSNDDVPNVTLVDGKISVKYCGEENAELKTALLGALTDKTQASLLAENEGTTTKPSLQDIFANIYDATIEMTVEFENYDAFKDQEHDQKEAEHASLITTGKATITICLGRGSIDEESSAVTGLEGTYKVSTSSTDPIVVLTKDNNIYKISLEDFAGSFKLDLTDESKGAELWIPNKDDDSINISIAKGSGTPVSLNWKTDLTDKNKIEADSNFSEKTAEQLDAEYFYQHFGSLRFLNALYAAFNNDNGDAGETYNNLQITGYSKETGITLTEGTSEAKVLTLNIDFGDGYRYYRGSDSYQTVSGKVTFIFTGTVENDKNEFKATGFKVKSDSTLNLSDSSTNSKVSKRPNATATISEEISGNFGEGKEGYITFTLKTGTEDGESVVTGITNYQADESKYNDDTNEFVLTADGGITSIEIELDN